MAGHFTDVEFILRMHHVSSFFSAEQHWQVADFAVYMDSGAKPFACFWKVKVTLLRILSRGCIPASRAWDLGTKEGLQRGLHTLREQWRRQQYDDFIAYPRDEAVEIAQAMHEGYNAARVKKAMRLYRTATAEGRGVMLSAGRSEECYARSRLGPPPEDDGHWCSTCSLCGAQGVPCWHHAAWVCPVFGSTRPDAHGDALTQRLGWPLAAEPAAVAEARLGHLAMVRKTLRERFGFVKQLKRMRGDSDQEEAGDP